jgi:hypothetical protein
METLKNSTRQLTLDELIYLQEDSPANRTAPQGNEKERKTNATCGRRCLELFESVHPVGSWERTFAGLLIGAGDWFSRRCALTWKLTGTPFNRLFFQLAPSTLPTAETESGLLLTPTTREEVMDTEKFKARMEKYPNGTTMPNLATQVQQMLPTPAAVDYKQTTLCESQRHRSTLPGLMVKTFLPTPMAQEHDKITGKENQDSMTKRVREATGKTSQLSPLFVEEMMGFPKGWTALPFQSGEENQSKHTETQ